MEGLHEFQHAHQVGDFHAGAAGDFLGHGLEKAGVVDIADDQLAELAVGGADVAGIELLDEVLLKRLAADEAVEEKLPPLLILRRAPGVALALRHVVAPLFIELGEAVEFLLKLVVLLFLVLDRRFHLVLFERGIRAQLLLYKVAQLQHWGLQNLQALLKLRCQNLILAHRLHLVHSGHSFFWR